MPESPTVGLGSNELEPNPLRSFNLALAHGLRQIEPVRSLVDILGDPSKDIDLNNDLLVQLLPAKNHLETYKALECVIKSYSELENTFGFTTEFTEGCSSVNHFY